MSDTRNTFVFANLTTALAKVVETFWAALIQILLRGAHQHSDSTWLISWDAFKAVWDEVGALAKVKTPVRSVKSLLADGRTQWHAGRMKRAQFWTAEKFWEQRASLTGSKKREPMFIVPWQLVPQAFKALLTTKQWKNDEAHIRAPQSYFSFDPTGVAVIVRKATKKDRKKTTFNPPQFVVTGKMVVGEGNEPVAGLLTGALRLDDSQESLNGLAEALSLQPLPSELWTNAAVAAAPETDAVGLDAAAATAADYGADILV